MAEYKFREISKDDINVVAQLLEERQRSEASYFSYLKNSCLNNAYITDSLNRLFSDKKIIGIGAFLNNELVGYMLGSVRLDTERGRHIWLSYDGIAIRGDQSAELIRLLYKEVSVLWLQHGCYKHYAVIPLGDGRYLEALQRLCFFIEQVHAVMDMKDYRDFNANTTSGLNIRFAEKGDGGTMGEMSSIILSYQNSAPTFAYALPEVVMSIKSGYEGTVGDDEATILIAEKNGAAIGFQGYWPQEAGLMAPEKGIELSIAGTVSSESGKGIGKALMNEGYRIMKEKGFEYMTTDWRIANLTSSTFWPKCGFKPVAYRMVRYIDECIGWANFNNPLIKK